MFQPGVMDAMGRSVAGLGKQVRFGAAAGLTAMARSIADGLPGQMQSQLDRPTQFTQRGVYVVRATPDDLSAKVGIKDIQSQYLQYQIEGGVRAPARRALKLPGDVQLDAYGNIPRTLIRQLVARAQAGRRVTKRQSQRFGVSKQVDLFYGEPGDGRPAGIYKRVGSGDHGRLVPVVIFPRRTATYRERFDFWGYCSRRAQAGVGEQIRAGVRVAVLTAK